MTNESEAMEVWLRAVNTFAQAPVPHRPTVFDQAAARVIATALEARDARIAELEGALDALIEQCWQSEKELTEAYYGTAYCGESLPLTSARATLTKGTNL